MTVMGTAELRLADRFQALKNARESVAMMGRALVRTDLTQAEQNVFGIAYFNSVKAVRELEDLTTLKPKRR
jgi:hypothetical protein